MVKFSVIFFSVILYMGGAVLVGNETVDQNEILQKVCGKVKDANCKIVRYPSGYYDVDCHGVISRAAKTEISIDLVITESIYAYAGRTRDDGVKVECYGIGFAYLWPYNLLRKIVIGQL